MIYKRIRIYLISGIMLLMPLLIGGCQSDVEPTETVEQILVVNKPHGVSEYQLREYPGLDGTTYRFKYDAANDCRVSASNGIKHYMYKMDPLYDVITTPYGDVKVLYRQDSYGRSLKGITYKDIDYDFVFDSANVLYIMQGDTPVAYYEYLDNNLTVTYEVTEDQSMVLNEDEEFVGNVNPFRYWAKGFMVYDTFTGLHYFDGKYADFKEKKWVPNPEFERDKDYSKDFPFQ